MTKQEFIETLNQKLLIISETERNDIIDEYVNHIDMKVSEGKSEAEAILDFGDLDELVDDILDAYKIDVKEAKKRHSEEKFNEQLDHLFDEAKKFIMRLTQLDFDRVVKLGFEFLVLLLVVWLLKIPVELIAMIGKSLLHDVLVFSHVGNILGNVWYGLCSGFYVILAMLFLIVIMKKRLDYYREQSGNASVMDDVKETLHFEKKEETKVMIETPIQKKSSDGVFGLTVKILLYVLMIPCIFMVAVFGCMVGILVFAWMEGVIYLGPWLLVIGGMIIFGSFIDLISYYIKGVK